jgi:hypothetical protein
MLDEAAADPVPGVVGMHRDLLDVQIPVDPAGDQIGDGRVSVHPGPAVALILPEGLGRRRLVLGDRRHPEVGEASAGGPLDLPQPLQLIGTRGPDHLVSAARQRFVCSATLVTKRSGSPDRNALKASPPG